MEKRYQVFVSSTYEDLKEERQEVIQALLELDCIPAGMELFPAADEDQWSLIKKVIDDCDYYIVIVGGRYGSISPQGVSYTQMEYEYAVSQGKPVMGFVHGDPGSIPTAKAEKTDEGRQKLEAFRAIVQKKMCKPWTSPDELGSVISRSLVKMMKSRPAVGWVRGNLVPEESASQEILKLRKRIDALQTELETARTETPKGIEGLAQGVDPLALRYTYRSYTQVDGRSPADVEYYAAEFVTTWDSVFSFVAPTMIDEATERSFKNTLDNFVSVSTREARLLAQPGKRTDNVTPSGDDFQTIKIQLRALNLITKSEKPRSVKDNATYWTLTPYGDTAMTKLRAVPRPATRRAEIQTASPS